jgi:ankyrin repeat protein
MWASEEGQEAAVDYLLSVGADTNCRDEVGSFRLDIHEIIIM